MKTRDEDRMKEMIPLTLCYVSTFWWQHDSDLSSFSSFLFISGCARNFGP